MMLDVRVLWLWLHLLGVILWAGGFFYVLMALVPAMGSSKATEDRVDIMQKAIAQFRRISWIAILLIIVSGVFNLIKRIGEGQAARELSTQPENYPLLPEGYMAVFGIKMFIVVGLIVHQAVKLLDPRVLDDGRIGLKSKASGIVAGVLFMVAILLGLVLMTMNMSV